MKTPRALHKPVHVFAIVAAAAAGAGAQAGTPGATCDGSVVSAIDIRSLPPRSGDTSTVRGTLEQVERSRHTTTRPEVIRAYLRLAPGRRCTERDRSESERLLRAQRFLAYATVRTRPDGAGRVRVEVETVDEVPILLGGGVRHGTVSALMLGTENLSGRGLTAALSYENGFHYRDGFGVRAVQYGAFRGPYTLAATGAIHPLGESWSLELAEPFLTDVQYSGFHSGAGSASDYYRVVRPAGEDLALYVRRATYDLAILTRTSPVTRGGPTGLIGAALMGEDVRPGTSPVIVYETGLVQASAGTQLGGGFQGSSVTRLAVLGGVRAVNFLTVRGFDALGAAQDIGDGAQIDALVGPAIRGVKLGGDMFLSSSVYWGAGDARSFVQFRAVGEGRTGGGTHSWHGLVANGRLTWYSRPSSDRTRTASVELSAIHGLGFPLQLTFRDGEGGLRGFADATLAGGTRAVARFEERKVFRPYGTFADIAVAGFAEAGQLWAGDVPFGRGSGLHGAAGISLLGAYPSGGKRTYRVDLAMPLSAAGGAGGAKFELRFSSTDRTRMLWQEPGDVARARAGAVPSNLVSWLPR